MGGVLCEKVANVVANEYLCNGKTMTKEGAGMAPSFF